MSAAPLTSMTVSEYLAWEPSQTLRHEYIRGQVVAMTGGTLLHNDIAINLITLLRPAVRAQGCRINIADAKVNVSPSIYRYPDLVVSCDARDKTALNAIHFPKLIVEVLSPATEGIDRGDKFQEYRTLSSLREYVLVSSTQIAVEVYRRGEGRMWLYYPYQGGDTMRLESLSVNCAVAQIYEDVSLAPG